MKIGGITPLVVRPYRPVVFFLAIAGVLAAGELSSLGSDIGARIFYFLLAWLAPITIHFYVALLGQRPGRREQFALWVFRLLAVLWSLPVIIFPFTLARELAWFDIWRANVRFGFAFTFVLAAFWLFRDYRQRASLAAQRRIRLVAFGTLFAFVPLLLLSLLPETIRASVHIPYQYTFPWLLLSPLAYWYARVRHRLVQTEETLDRALVYYLIGILLISLLIATRLSLDLLSIDISGEWLPISVLVSIGVLVLFIPLHQVLHRFVKWVLYGREIGDVRVVEGLSVSLARMLDRETVRRLLVKDLASAMGLSRVALFLKDEQQALSLLDATGFARGDLGRYQVATDSSLAQYLEVVAEPVTSDC